MVLGWRLLARHHRQPERLRARLPQFRSDAADDADRARHTFDRRDPVHARRHGPHLHGHARHGGRLRRDEDWLCRRGVGARASRLLVQRGQGGQGSGCRGRPARGAAYAGLTHKPDETDAKEQRGMTTFRALFAALMVVASFGLALAKLPPPPMDDAAKAAAEEKKAKDAAAAEAAKQLPTRIEDRVAARYIAEKREKGIIVTPQLGPGGPPTDAVKGLSSQPEKAMAHSPAKK